MIRANARKSVRCSYVDTIYLNIMRGALMS